VLRRHRKEGVGRALATHLWREFPGEWLVRVLAANRPAVPFWRAAVRDFRGDAFEESVVQHRGREWIHLRFDAAPSAPAPTHSGCLAIASPTAWARSAIWRRWPVGTISYPTKKSRGQLSPPRQSRGVPSSASTPGMSRKSPTAARKPV